MTVPLRAEKTASAQPARQPYDDGLRYEKKFILNRYKASDIEALIRHHPAIFRRAFPDRQVNNIYLDSWDLSYYRDNLDGLSNRQKFRIRWYGVLEQPDASVALERKSRVGQAGRKWRFPLGNLDTTSGIDRQAVQSVLGRAAVRVDVRSELASLHPVLVNQYHRQYFESLDRKLRLTVDREQLFLPVFVSAVDSGTCWRQDKEEIVELKYALSDEALADSAAQSFPFRLGRYSKYARGISLIRMESVEQYFL
jgi:hypothetical protein